MDDVIDTKEKIVGEIRSLAKFAYAPTLLKVHSSQLGRFRIYINESSEVCQMLSRGDFVASFGEFLKCTDSNMSEERKEKSCVWPVIVHKSQTNLDVVSSLKQRNFVIRASENVVPGSVIFPSSGGIAFLIVPLDQVTVRDPDTQKLDLSSELINRADNFIKVHRHCYLLCKAPIHGDTERQIFSLIQQQYLRSRLQMLPVHNIQEAVTSMVTIAKGLCKPYSDMLFSRLDKIVSDIQHADFMSSALKSVNLNGQEILAVQEQFGNLAELATASETELVECGVDTKTANKLCKLFSKQTRGEFQS